MTLSTSSKLSSLEALAAQLSAPPEDVELQLDVDPTSLDDDFLVCHCTNTTAGELREVIHEGGAASLAEVQRCTRAGGGCGKCVPLLTEFVHIELSQVTVR